MQAPIGTSFFRQLLPYLGAIVGAVAVIVGIVLWLTGPDLKDVGLELIKSLVQVATVIVLGQVLAIIVKDREHERDTYARELAAERDRQAALTALRTEVVVKLSNAFVRVKGSRRLLRAEALTVPWSKTLDPATQVRRDSYCQQMQAINIVELELESLWHQLEATNPTAERATLVDNVKIMKDYLRELLFNYEHVLPQFAPGAVSLPIESFRDNPEYGTLIDFIDAAQTSGFRQRFVKPFRAASSTIRTALLSGSAP